MMSSNQILGSIAVSVLTSIVGLFAYTVITKPPAPAPITVSRLAGNEKSPIASGVFAPAGVDTVYLSGQLADPANSDAPKDSPEYYGDTETQTISIMKKIERALAEKHMTMGDIAMMHVYLVADPNKGNKMDFKGMMAGYLKYFGTEQQPNKTARSTFQVAGLVAPGYLAEIEVLAVAAPK
jgi:enamine deaminase RidA (YjgF/YER057c/UK114 family)